MYDILFVPTSRILKFSAQVRFGRKGLHPDLSKNLHVRERGHDGAAGRRRRCAGQAAHVGRPLGLSDTLVVMDERCEQMVNWVGKVLSRNMAARLLEFFEWGSRAVKHDRKGLLALADWKCLLLDVLDDASRHIDVQLYDD